MQKLSASDSYHMLHLSKQKKCTRWLITIGCMFTSLLASPAHALITQFSSGMGYSGTLPFDGVAGAGRDSSATDNVVRTFDKLSYQVGYSLSQSDTGGVVKATLGATTLPLNYVGAPLPQIARFMLADMPSGLGGCQAITSTPLTAADIAAGTMSGISADGQTLVCVQPSPAGSATFNLTLSVSGTAPNGTTIAPPSITYQSTNNPVTTALTISNDGINTFGLPLVSVSAAPRWNLAKQLFLGGQFVPGSGPLGQDGVVFSWNLGVFAQGSRKGLELINGAYSISENFNDARFPNAQFVTWNMASPSITANFSAAGQNGCGDWQREFFINTQFIDDDVYFPNDLGNAVINPAFRLPYQVLHGGSCDQTAVNNVAKTATLTLNNTDFSLDSYPTQNGSAGIVTLVNPNNLDDTTNQWWVASKSVAIWAPLTDLPVAPAPSVTYLTNNVSFSATSVTGQANVEPITTDNSSTAMVDGRAAGRMSKSHTAFAFSYSNPLGLDAAPPDPNITGDSIVNQVGPGQLLNVRLIISNTGATPLPAGYVCDRLDNSRFTYFDATPASYNTWSKDAATGIISFTYSGTPTAMTWRLGVSGTGIVGIGGTWSSFNTVTNEYINPATTGATQADSACGDPAKGEPNDGITWYASVAALLAVEGPNGLQKVTRVRGDYTSLPASTTVISTYPQQTNVTYSYSGTDNAPGAAFVAGTTTVGAMAVNQAMWQSNNASIGTAGVVKDSDAVKIFFNEFIQVGMVSSSNPIANSSVAAGSLIGFDVTVNATSTSNQHFTNVDVWVAMPNYTSYVAGSSTLGGATLPDPVCTNTGLPVGLFPAATQPLAAGFSACHWLLLNQPVTRATVGDVAANLPVLKFNQLLSASVPSGTQLLTSSFASSTNNAKYLAVYGGGQPSPAATPAAAAIKGFGCNQYFPCSTSSWTLSASTTSGLLLSQQVDKGAIFPDNSFSYTLNYSTMGAPLDGVRLLDVLPYSVDGRGSNYLGTLKLVAPIATPVIGAMANAADATLVVRYTNNAPANIIRDPYATAQNLTGTGTNSFTSTNWCTPAQFGLAGCPVTIADATAFMAFPMFTSAPSGHLVAGNSYSLIVPVVSAANTVGNVYNNNFIGDSPTLQARTPGSNSVSTTVVLPDLTLKKTIIGVCAGAGCVPAAYVAGQVIPANAKIRYQLDYSNASYTVAQTNVVLSDSLPIATAAAAVSNVVIVSGPITAPTAATLAGLAAGGATLSFPTLASLAPRTVGVITLDVQTTAPAGSSITNQAHIMSSQDPLGLSSSVTVDVPNLLLSKTTSTANVAQGGVASYTVTIQNASASPVTALQLYDFLPFAGTVPNAGSQFNYVLASATFTGGLPATVATTSRAPTIAPYSANLNQQQVAWNFGAFSLAAGAIVTVSFNATVAGAMPPAIYNNSAAVSYSVAGVVKTLQLDGAAGVSVLSSPVITVTKTVQVFSDPVNGTTNPKFIPGAQASYTISVSNAGGVADLNSITITDPVPANVALYVKDLGVAGSGPVLFTQGATSSGLTYSYSAAAPATDDLEFFGGAAPGAWTYLPVAGADGCDPLVTNVRIKPKGIFLGNAAAPSPSFSLQFRVCVQ